MACGVALAAALFLASGPALPSEAPQPQPAAARSVASEPLFADIIARAAKLKAQVESYRALPNLKASPGAVALPGFDAFTAEIGALAELDKQGHLEMARRGTDGDLKCILWGMHEDLPIKLRDLQAASSGAAQDRALSELAYLLNDNVEVITAPPAPPV